MEKRFNSLASSFYEGNFHPREDPEHAEQLRVLKAYYEGPLWKEDYAADERGELPALMLRGVISQDGLYNLLTDIEESNS